MVSISTSGDVGVGVDVNEAMGTEFVSFLFTCFSFSDSREIEAVEHDGFTSFSIFEILFLFS
jgi:hypothetical protein